MTNILLIVMGNQLYANHKVGLKEGISASFTPDSSIGADGRSGYVDLGPGTTPIFMAEDMGLCRRFRYHRHKLLLVLSAMRSHRDFLRGRHEVYYYPLVDSRSYFEKLKEAVRETKTEALAAYEPDDFQAEEELKGHARRLGLPLFYRASKSFLMSGHEVSGEWQVEADGRAVPDFYSFYISRLNRMGILMDGAEPEGGHWFFDQETHRPFPEDIRFLPLPRADWTKYTAELAEQLSRFFPDNPGDPADFFLPTTRVQALKWLDSFFQYRFPQFDLYENAIHRSELLGSHSLLSPLLNIGLVFPGEVLEAALNCDVPPANKERFIRGIIGRREFVRGMYLSRRNPERKDFSQQSRRLGPSWYDGTTGIPILDESIRKVLHYGYVHRTERLVVLGNLMVLCEVHPQEMYRWFSEMCVDGYDWVIKPNVDSLRSFPFIVSSQYLLKISNYPEGPWCDIVDGLFLRFVHLHHHQREKRIDWVEHIEPQRFKYLQHTAEVFIAENTELYSGFEKGEKK